jgi:hypothetical protein
MSLWKFCPLPKRLKFEFKCLGGIAWRIAVRRLIELKIWGHFFITKGWTTSKLFVAVVRFPVKLRWGLWGMLN